MVDLGSKQGARVVLQFCFVLGGFMVLPKATHVSSCTPVCSARSHAPQEPVTQAQERLPLARSARTESFGNPGAVRTASTFALESNRRAERVQSSSGRCSTSVCQGDPPRWAEVADSRVRNVTAPHSPSEVHVANQPREGAAWPGPGRGARLFVPTPSLSAPGSRPPSRRAQGPRS